MIKSKDAKNNQLLSEKISRSNFLKFGKVLAGGSYISTCSAGASKNNSANPYYNRADNIANPPMMAPAIPLESRKLADDPATVPPPVKYAKPKIHNVNFLCEEILKGALPEKIKQLITEAAAHVTHCPYSVRSYILQAIRKGASKQALMEAIWIATEMRSRTVIAHASITLDEMNNLEKSTK